MPTCISPSTSKRALMRPVYSASQERHDKDSSKKMSTSSELEPICICGHDFLFHEKSNSCRFVYEEHEQVLNGKPVTLTIRCGCRRFEAKICLPYNDM